MYQRGLNHLLVQQARSSKLQEQLATGLKVQIASDDPIKASQIELMMLRISSLERYEQNGQAADSKLRTQESIISGSVSSLQRLREIQIQAGNNTLSENDRKSLANEVANLLSQLQNDANTKDSDGYYLFSGGHGSTPAVSLNAAGKYVYNGDSTQRYQSLSDTLQVAINDTADKIFMSIPTGNGHFTVSQTAAPNAGTAVLSSGAVVNSANYTNDNFTLNFAHNSQGQLVYLVSGATSGNVVPASGLADDAPLYQEGGVIRFNGIEITPTGMPEVGDAFVISPSHNDSIFSTLQDMITALNQPFSTTAEKASVQTQNNQLLEQLDSALNNLLGIQTEIGNRLNQIERVAATNSDLKITSNETLKSLREIDATEVATEFNIQLVNLQAAQQSFVRIQGLSVFNYI